MNNPDKERRRFMRINKNLMMRLSHKDDPNHVYEVTQIINVSKGQAGGCFHGLYTGLVIRPPVGVIGHFLVISTAAARAVSTLFCFWVAVVRAHYVYLLQTARHGSISAWVAGKSRSKIPCNRGLAGVIRG